MAHSFEREKKQVESRSIDRSKDRRGKSFAIGPSPTRIFATSRDQGSLCLREGLERLRELASAVGGAPQLFQTPSETKGSNSEEVSEGDV